MSQHRKRQQRRARRTLDRNFAQWDREGLIGAAVMRWNNTGLFPRWARHYPGLIDAIKRKGLV